MAGLGIFVGLLFAVLAGRLVQLQVFEHETWRKVADENTQRTFLRQPQRGGILDVNGNPLAVSLPVKRVLANPKMLGAHYAEVAAALAPLLAYQPAELAQLLKPTVVRTNAKGGPVLREYVNLRRKVTLEQWQQVTQALARVTARVNDRSLPRAERSLLRGIRRYGVYAVDDQQRVYPSRNTAAHVVGYVREQENNFNHFSVMELAGWDGIERWLDRQLTGVRGWRITELDRRQNEIVAQRLQEVEPRAGLNVVLTLDLFIQNMVETALAEAMKQFTPISAQALVMRPATGEILAMATLPNFDPNEPNRVADTAWLRNRVISDMMEPGSTFKIVTIAAALNEGVVTLDDWFNCENGHWYYLGHVLRDHGKGYGTLNLLHVIAKSSNIGVAKVAVQRLNAQKLYEYARAFGFGVRAGVTLPGEHGGWLHPVKDWDRLTLSRMAIGQSLTVTHLQMMLAMCAVANDGRLMRPMLVSRLVEPSGQVFAEYRPQMVRQVVPKRIARELTTALKVVPTREGTAEKAELELYTGAGKTGTAQKAANRVYVPGKYVASYIGFFPADAPEICISVVLDEPDKDKGYYGGQTAATVFKRIAEQVASYLKIRPDRPSSFSDALAAATLEAPVEHDVARNN